jgi:hypothetical protein
MSSYRRNGKLERQREQEHAAWRTWVNAHSHRFFALGIPWYAGTSRAMFESAIVRLPTWRLTKPEKHELLELLGTLDPYPRSNVPEACADLRDSLRGFRPPLDEAWEQAEAEQERELELEALRRATSRQLRLFAADCCRRAPGLSDLDCDGVLDVIESYADDQADAADLTWARNVASAAATWARANDQQAATQAAELLKAAAQVHLRPHFKLFLELEEPLRASWRELLGNPFRPLREQCLTASHQAARLAAAIYQERAFDGMPMLGDALEESGCREERVLAHCRDASARHTRGCWALDWALRETGA